jgi:hypothetical protein
MVTKLEVKRVLFDDYDGFADKRLKKIERDAPFIIDDRQGGDYDARGQLFLWFCAMYAEVEEGDQVRLTLSGGVPQADAISKWFSANGGNERETFSGRQAVIIVTPDNFHELTMLAGHFDAIIERKYSVNAYKYVVPRVRTSLMKFHSVLTTVWN